MNSPNNGSRNRLLSALSHTDRDLLTPALETVDLDVRHVLEVPNDPISHVYFVESGLVSIVGTAAPSHRIEIGMVGYEGMTGLSIVLGADRSANETLVQSSGWALRISTESLRGMLEASRSLSDTLLRYVNVFMVQASQTALANGRGLLNERLARWLLMWDDRVQPDALTVTHDFVALLLGVHRPGVTNALHDLEGKGLIQSTRGAVRILDREGLSLAANGFYGVPEAEYARSMGTRRGRNPDSVPAFSSTQPEIL
jgi:CRP-like cAMP-binding protein